MNDYQRGVIAAQLVEPFNEEESDDWMAGYFHEVYHPSGGLVPQYAQYDYYEEDDYIYANDEFEPGRPYWNEIEANP